MFTLRLPLAGILFTLALAAHTHAENWPQWRGAKLDGVSHEKDLPVKWSKTEGIAWRLELPGAAGATPVVWGDKIFLTSVDGNNLIRFGLTSRLVNNGRAGC